MFRLNSYIVYLYVASLTGKVHICASILFAVSFYVCFSLSHLDQLDPFSSQPGRLILEVPEGHSIQGFGRPLIVHIYSHVCHQGGKLAAHCSETLAVRGEAQRYVKTLKQTLHSKVNKCP